MKAMLLTEPKQLQITDVPEPAVGPGDVLVAVRACGICGSDVHGFDGSSGRRIPPLVMGHEAAGVIEQVGAGVEGFAVGDRVTFDSTVSCGDCDFCRDGRINLCDNRMVLGVSCAEYRRHGAFAEYVSVPANILYKLPDNLPFEHAALIEAVSVAVHAVGRTPADPNGTALVVGSGMIGLLVVQALRAAGWGTVLAADLQASRLEAASGMGADGMINVGEQDLVEAVAAKTGGRGADAAFEVVGITPTVGPAINAVRKGGAVVLVGNLQGTVDLPLQAVVTRELTLFGSCASSGEYPECIRLMSEGKIDVRPLISAQAPLDDGPAWFDRLYDGGEDLMKVILTP